MVVAGVAGKSGMPASACEVYTDGGDAVGGVGGCVSGGGSGDLAVLFASARHLTPLAS